MAHALCRDHYQSAANGFSSGSVKRHYIHALVNNAHLINSSIQAGRCLLSF